MKLVLYIGLLFALIGVIYGLKCYTCEGNDSFLSGDSCGDEYDKDTASGHLMMCNATAGEIWCRKEKTGANNIFTHVERGCASQCEERNDGYIRRVTCCNNEDGCNHASSMYLSLATIVLSFVFALVF